MADEEGSSILDDSPIEQVRLTVPPTDDNTLQVLTFRTWLIVQVLTFRTWLIGIPICILGSVSAALSFYRQQMFFFSYVCINMMVFIAGKLMANMLPNKVIRMPYTNWSFSLNPGPFNLKEHVATTMLAGRVSASAGFEILTISKIFYHKDIPLLPAILLVLSIQLLVHSPYMWWPSTLVDVAFYRALHEPEKRAKGKLSRYQFFIIVIVAIFTYSIIPVYLFPSITALSFVCWIWKDSITAQQIGSGFNALGIGSFALDWMTMSSYMDMGSNVKSPACSLDLKLKRTSKYNLSDDEEDDTTVDQPHSSDKDDFEDEVPLDDDEDADFKNGGGLASPKHLSLQSLQNSSESSLLDGEDQTHKSKKQVMMEIISKSKFYKAQKVKEKEEDESLMAKLDEDFSMLAQTEALQALSHPSKMNALKALLNKDIKRESLKEGSSGLSDNKLIEKGHPDAYDKLVKELGSDRRAHASDRTKTPEEIAQEEKERLEELEKQRRERMLATDDSTDEGSDDDNVEIQNSASIKIRPTSGDDLGDSFSIADDVTGKKGWIDGIYEQNDADNQDESDSSSQDSEGDEDNEGDGDGKDGSGDEHVNISTMKDWEQSDDDDDGLNMDGEETENIDEKEVAIGDKLTLDLHEVKTSSSHEMNAAGNLAPAKEKELPYVIEAPKNLTELCSLLDSRSDDEVVEIINRIRAYNSIRLAAENRKKMQIFYGVLLQYFAVLATQSPLNFKIINSLVKPLVEMSAETPYFAAICARQRLIHIRTHFLEDIKNPGKSCWPTLKTLLLLRLWSLVFPCSDFRHVVMTPALLLMCEYLMRCPINSGQDAARGSFLCSLVFSVCKQSQKFCPEAIIYLQTLLTSSIELKLGLQQHSQLNHLMEIRVLKPWLHITDQTCAIHPLDFFAVMEMQEESPFFATDTFRASVLSSVSETLKGFIIIYEGFSSFAEIFSPISNLLHEVLQNPNLPGLLRDKMQDVLDLIKKKTDEHHMFRKPLQMRKQKPVPIKLLNPKFEENFVKGRDYDPDRERAEMKKLKKLLKSEKKGAIRELRKDSQFVSGLKETGRLMQEEERAEKYGKAMAFLQEQEYAFKSGQLGKGRKRR